MDADVIVIGAGAAGLAAARSLAARSLRVIVLEARDRVGGRVLSHPVGRTVTPAELGAEFIHGHALETMRLLKEAGSAAIAMGGESWVRSGDGLQGEDNDFFEAAGIFEGSRSFQKDESVEQFLRRFEDDDAMRETAHAARAFVEGFEAADPAIASAQAIADEWRSGNDSTSARPLGGYRPVFDHLRNECQAAGAGIRLSTIVQRISWRRAEVAVDTIDASGAVQTIGARAAIVTLPVGVLRHRGDETEIAFEPELPGAKLKALESVEMGHVVKVVLSFRTAFWEALANGRYLDAGFFRGDGGRFAAFWTQFPVRTELICAWAGGLKATALDGASQEQLIDAALDEFGEILGATGLAHDEFEGGFVHDWQNDQFARGAYSYLAVGGGDARATLAQPLDDALFFAGEATSTDGQGGTVNGAFETGERAAAQAAAALNL